MTDIKRRKTDPDLIRFKWKNRNNSQTDAVLTLTCGIRIVLGEEEDLLRNKKLIETIKEKMELSLGDEQIGGYNDKKMCIAVTRNRNTDYVCGAVFFHRLEKVWRMIDLEREEKESDVIKKLVKDKQPLTTSSLESSLPSPTTIDVPDSAEEWAQQNHVASHVTSGQGCVCGISRIWVEEDYRRIGIGTGLVDGARSSLVFGYEIPAAQVAFSQPTVTGKLLAATYTSRADFFVYS